MFTKEFAALIQTESKGLFYLRAMLMDYTANEEDLMAIYRKAHAMADENGTKGVPVYGFELVEGNSNRLVMTLRWDNKVIAAAAVASTPIDIIPGQYGPTLQLPKQNELTTTSV